MKSMISQKAYRFVFFAFLSVFLLPSSIGQTMDVEFVNFQVDDSVTIGQSFLVSGTLRNNGSTVVPANLDMMIETYMTNQSTPVFDGDYIQDNFGNVNLQPSQTYNFARYITADPAHFAPDEKIIVIIWPVAPTATDIDSTNNYHYEQIYVRAAAPQGVNFTASVCNDQTLPFGFEGSNTAYIRANVVGGTPPYAYSWNTGHTTSEIEVAPTTTTTYFVTVSDASGNGVVLAHTINVVDIRCDNNKVTMCHQSSSSPHTHCIDRDYAQKKMSEGYTPGNCFTVFTRADCGTPPLLGCECDDGMTSISLQYNGASGATVSGYLEDKNDDPLESYSNVQTGDVLTFTSASTGENKFKSKTFFRVNGQGDGEEIHTSCSQDIQGGTFGAFTVVEFIDGEGYTCQAPDLTCQCVGGLQTVSLRYNGPAGIDFFVFNGTQGSQLGSFFGVNTGDVFNLSAAAIGQSQIADFIRIENTFNSEFQAINTNCSDELIGTYGDFEIFAYTDILGNNCPVPPMDCDCDGGIKAVAFTYTGGAGSTILLYNKDDEFIESHSNVQTGERFVVYAGSIGKEKFSDLRIHVLGNSPIDLHTSCSQDIVGSYNDIEITGYVDKENGNCNVPDYVAPPEPCDCDGGIKVVAFSYTGNSGGTINVFNKDNEFIESHSNVQNGESFVVYAASIGEEKFSDLRIHVLGNSPIDLHTSCSQDIVGSYNGIDVTGFVDKYNGICNVPDYVAPPEPCDCDGGIKVVAFSYTGNSGGTINVFNKDNEFIESHTNVQNGESFVVYAASIGEEKFSDLRIHVLGNSPIDLHTSCSQDIVGSYNGIDITGFVDKENGICNVPDYVAPPGSCDCDGGVKAISFTYNGMSGATINVYNSDDGSDLIASYTNTQNGADFVVYASTIGEEKFNKEFTILVSGSNNVELHTSCSQPIIGTYGNIQVTGYVDKEDGVCNVPEYEPPVSCDCDGGMKLISLQHVGNTFATLSAYNDKDIKQDELIRVATLFPFDIFTITSASINESDFNNSVALAVNGVKIGELHTSCSQEIIGQQIGNFVVVEHQDTEGNVCSTLAIPQSRETVDLSTFMHVFPNPAKDELNLYFQLPDADIVSVGLYNMEGRLVKNLMEEETEGLEENEIKFYLKGVSPGMYFIRTTTFGGMYGFKKVVVIP